MKKRKRKKRKGFYQILAEDIVAGSPFDLSGNLDGCTTIQETITCYRLRELSEVDKHKCWSEELKEIKACFWPAIHYINDNPDDVPEFRNIHISIHRPTGKRNNEFLSINKDYREARSRNTDRLFQRIKTVTRPAIKEIKQTQPERISELQMVTKQLLLGDIETQVLVKASQ